MYYIHAMAILCAKCQVRRGSQAIQRNKCKTTTELYWKVCVGAKRRKRNHISLGECYDVIATFCCSCCNCYFCVIYNTFGKTINTHTHPHNEHDGTKLIRKIINTRSQFDTCMLYNIQVLMDCAHNLIKLLRASQQASEWVEWIFCLTLSKLPERGDANVYTFGWHFRWNALFSLCSFSFSKSVTHQKISHIALHYRLTHLLYINIHNNAAVKIILRFCSRASAYIHATQKKTTRKQLTNSFYYLRDANWKEYPPAIHIYIYIVL